MSGSAGSVIKDACPGAEGSGAGVRVLIVAMKRSNVRGAKEDRKVEA
jgi:hypothetical protein